MGDTTTAYIGLGSNLGDRQDYINKALKILSETEDIKLTRTSDFIETAPLSQADQPNYINAVAEIQTDLTAQNLLAKMIEIENSLGRTRDQKWAPRTIDLDLLLFGKEIINTPDLTVPHPHMHFRSFVLKALSQLNPNLLHPILKESISELTARLNGADFTLNPDQPQLISIAGLIGVGKTTLAKKLSSIFDCKILLEAYDTNPFMPDVYAGKEQLALDSQLYFLTSRLAQLNPLALQPAQIIISDYIFQKELIYAKRLLNPSQLELYEQVYPPLSKKILSPVLVVYLIDSPQNCLKRIHKRNRPYEQKIESKFLEDLNSDYEKLFADWKTSPVIRLPISELDYTINANIENLANQIRSYVAI